MAELSSDIETMQAALAAYYPQIFPADTDPQVINLVRINDGWESDVYAFQAISGPADQCITRDLILRIYPGQDAYEKSAGEYRSLTLLRQTGYPVPAVYCLERDHSPFGQPFIVMEKIQGRSLWPLLFHNPDVQDRQRNLEMFCNLFIRLHRIDWRPHVPDPIVFEPGTPTGLIDRQLDHVRHIMNNSPMPGFQRVIQWLEDHKHEAANTCASPVHLDFHPNNILVCTDPRPGDEPAYVIDWTNFQISDSRFDLAWTLLLILSYEGPQAREMVLHEYERQNGGLVEGLAYFDVATAFARLFTIVFSIRNGAEQMGMRPGAENIMRDQKEPIRRVYQLLQERSGLNLPEVEELFAGISG